MTFEAPKCCECIYYIGYYGHNCKKYSDKIPSDILYKNKKCKDFKDAK